MAKWFGKVGYAIAGETKPDVWEDIITEREYFGDAIRITRRLEGTDEIIDDLAISVTISIVADPYAYNNFHTIKYVEYMGNLWKVTSVDPAYPRLNLNLGGLYHGKESG